MLLNLSILKGDSSVLSLPQCSACHAVVCTKKSWPRCGYYYPGPQILLSARAAIPYKLLLFTCAAGGVHIRRPCSSNGCAAVFQWWVLAGSY